jgi:hypothetical protein
MSNAVYSVTGENAPNVLVGHIHNATVTTERIIAAVQSLSDAHSTGPSRKASTLGIPLSFDAIEKHIAERFPGTSLQDEHLQKCLYREVDCGRLVELVNGCFVLADRVDRSMKVNRELIVLPPQVRKGVDKKKIAQMKREKFLKSYSGDGSSSFGETEPEWRPHQKKVIILPCRLGF